jgi:hypothetical protein
MQTWVVRIKTFLGEAANRDMKFQEFMDIVQKRFDDPGPEKSPLRDFYEEKQVSRVPSWA